MSRSIEWKSDFFTNNGNKIHYYRTGGDKPPVLLLHGVMDNGLCWAPLGRVLASDYDVILPDARGHGLTHISDETWTYEAMADDVALLIKDLNVDKIQLVAVDHPDSVDIFVPEQFSPPPFPGLDIYQVNKKYFPVSAKDSNGNDLLPFIVKKDNKYLAILEGAYEHPIRKNDINSKNRFIFAMTSDSLDGTWRRVEESENEFLAESENLYNEDGSKSKYTQKAYRYFYHAFGVLRGVADSFMDWFFSIFFKVLLRSFSLTGLIK